MSTTNQNTLNQLNKVLSNFAANHQQLNSYYFGDYWEQTASGTTRYPSMVATFTGNSLDGNDFLWNFQIVIEDKIMDGEQNETEILSDVVQIAQDVISYLHQTLTKSTNYGSMILDKSIDIEPFTEKGTDGTGAVVLNITLREGFPFNKCQIPIT